MKAFLIIFGLIVLILGSCFVYFLFNVASDWIKGSGKDDKFHGVMAFISLASIIIMLGALVFVMFDTL